VSAIIVTVAGPADRERERSVRATRTVREAESSAYFCCRSARHRNGRAPSHHDYGRSQPMGARGARRADPRRVAAQARQRGARRSTSSSATGCVQTGVIWNQTLSSRLHRQRFELFGEKAIPSPHSFDVE